MTMKEHKVIIPTVILHYCKLLYFSQSEEQIVDVRVQDALAKRM